MLPEVKIAELELKIEHQLLSYMYKLAYVLYNDLYSSRDYSQEINALKLGCGVLVDLCKTLELDVSDLKISYCDYEIEYDDLTSFEDQTKWM